MASRPAQEEGELLWQPPSGAFDNSRMGAFANWLKGTQGLSLDTGYDPLWRWSTADVDGFWRALWDHFEVLGERPAGPVLGDRSMPGAEWFPAATVNYAENALRYSQLLAPALLAHSEVRQPVSLSGEELLLQVGSLAEALRQLGVGPGDRVAAYLPNIPEAVVALLATASLGAIWSSCSPDFGERAVLDRFQQIEPKVLFAVDGYRYGGRDFARSAVVARLRQGLLSLQAVVTVPYLEGTGGPGTGGPGTVTFGELVATPRQPEFVRVPFQHPLWILYSSGTTGPPKAIVQSHGGIVLEHLKVLALHADMGPGDRSFWFTTTGWMMWNYLVGALLVGATAVLYDGSPAHPDANRLFSLAEEAEVTHFGSSAAHLGACLKLGLRPSERLSLERLRFLGSTGSPLSPAAFAWVYRELKSELWVSSLSGGTDLCTAFVLGCPGLPVRAGVIQCRGLGADVAAFDDRGEPVLDRVGELVIRQPMPSMPVFLWGDQGGDRYRESYFADFPGVWRHGDWIKVRRDGGVVMYGRSDSTINRHGVRMGTSELYRVVEELPEVADSLVVDVARPGGDSELHLFLVLAGDRRLDEALRRLVRDALRREISPRHVPDRIHQVQVVPRTLSGKKLEVPIKRILSGTDPALALDRDSVADPASLVPFLELALAGGDTTS